MQKGSPKQKLRPRQQQRKPGSEERMEPLPKSAGEHYKAAGKLQGKVAVITGGDSGIGRAVAIAFAKEGARVTIAYLSEHKDAQETARLIRENGGECLPLAGDIGSEAVCKRIIRRTMKAYGRLDILVNNAGAHTPQESITRITRQQLERTFRTNVFSFFHLTKAALPHLKPGSAIINTASVTAYRGSAQLIDYAATKGAIVSFTRSLAASLMKKDIRVNAVAPGPVWTPLIPSSMSPAKTASFGSDAPMGRAGEPEEIAPCYVFLASDDSSYISGQVMHPNGGEVVNG